MAETILSAFKKLFFKEIDDFNRKANRERKFRPPCPKCEAVCVTKIGQQFRCSQCGHQWPPIEELKFQKPMTRAKWLEDNPQ